MLITCSRIQRLLTTLSKSAQEGDLKYGLVWILNGQKRLVGANGLDFENI